MIRRNSLKTLFFLIPTVFTLLAPLPIFATESANVRLLYVTNLWLERTDYFHRHQKANSSQEEINTLKETIFCNAYESAFFFLNKTKGTCPIKPDMDEYGAFEAWSEGFKILEARVGEETQKKEEFSNYVLQHLFSDSIDPSARFLPLKDDLLQTEPLSFSTDEEELTIRVNHLLGDNSRMVFPVLSFPNVKKVVLDLRGTRFGILENAMMLVAKLGTGHLMNGKELVQVRFVDETFGYEHDV